MFTGLAVTTDVAKSPWKDLDGADFGQIIRLGRLPKATVEGNSAIVLAIQFQDGSIVMGQTTMKLMATSMEALKSLDDQENGNTSKN